MLQAIGTGHGPRDHPERYLSWLNHPYWTRLPSSLRAGSPAAIETPGLMMFRNAVAAVSPSHAMR